MNEAMALSEENFINTHYGVVIHRDFIPLHSDENYAKILGFQSAKEVMSLSSLFEVIHPADHESARINYREIMAGRQQPRMQTCKNRDRNGNEITVLTIDHVIDWEGGKSLQVTIIDVSSYLVMRKKLRKNEERYRSLIDTSLQGMLVYQNLKLVFCNRAFASMFGFSDTEVLIQQRDILSLLSPEFHFNVLTRNEVLISGEKNFVKEEVKGIKADGSYVWLNVLLNAVEWNGDAAIQVSAIDITEQYQLRKELEIRANYDGLTNLLNRRAMSEIVETQFKEASGVATLCCVLIDFDDFKMINDQYGHDAGDEVLKCFASASQKLIRSGDFIGRWGGEEFLLLLPNTHLNDAKQIAERLRGEIAKLAIMHENTNISFTASMGVAVTSLVTPNARILVSNADHALYEAKRQGKNCVLTYN
jgi:diguanylate cyclase (GGDEF)-like protein/PAS domain S-box-containing protein